MESINKSHITAGYVAKQVVWTPIKYSLKAANYAVDKAVSLGTSSLVGLMGYSGYQVCRHGAAAALFTSLATRTNAFALSSFQELLSLDALSNLSESLTQEICKDLTPPPALNNSITSTLTSIWDYGASFFTTPFQKAHCTELKMHIQRIEMCILLFGLLGALKIIKSGALHFGSTIYNNHFPALVFGSTDPNSTKELPEIPSESGSCGSPEIANLTATKENSVIKAPHPSEETLHAIKQHLEMLKKQKLI